MYLTKSSVNIPEIYTTQDEPKPFRNTFDLEMETINHLQSDLEDELDATGERVGERAGESIVKDTINYAPGTEEVMEEASPEVVEIEIPGETYSGGVEETSSKGESSPAVVEIHEVLETSPEPMETSPAMESQQMEIMEIMETSPAMEHQMESQLMESPGIVETDTITESDLVSTGAEFGDTDRQHFKDGQDSRQSIIDIGSEDDIENLDENDETFLGEEREMDQESQRDLTDQEIQHNDFHNDFQNDLMNDLSNHPTQSEDIPDKLERDTESGTGATENGNNEEEVTKNIHNDTYKDTENSHEIPNENSNEISNENSHEISNEISNESNASETTNTPSTEPNGKFTEPNVISNTSFNASSNTPSESNYVAESVFAEFSDSDEELPVDIKLPMPIIVRIADTEFLLVPFNESCSHLVSLFDDTDILNQTIEGFFSLIRSLEDLNEIHPFSIEDELVLRVPELKMTITEDNIYSREITIEDFVKTFISLTENTKNHESIPKHLSLNLTSQTRFITNFNSLSEVIRSGLGFEVLTRGLKHKIEESDGRMDKKRRISFSDDINESL